MRELLQGYRWLICLFVCALLGAALAQERLELRISSAPDDAEEFQDETVLGPAGTVYLDSSDLELVEDIGATQVVGLRFADVPLPAGAQLLTAYVQFTTKEASDRPTELTIAAEAADDAPPFEQTPFNISERPTVMTAATWSPEPWTQVGEAGEAQRTPDLAGVLQEVVARPGWEAGNALVLIISGSGHRVAWAVDGRPQAAPVLVVEYRAPEQAAQPEPAPAEPAAEEPVVEEPVVEEPVAEEPVVEEPITEEPVAEEPITEEPVAEEPVADEPVADEPAIQEPTAVQPAPVGPTTVATVGERAVRYTLGALEPGVSASLLVADYGNTVLLTLLVSQPNAAGLSAVLSAGSCAAPGEVVQVLTPTNQGGYSVTVAEADFATLTEGDFHVTLYAETGGMGAALACGEVGR